MFIPTSQKPRGLKSTASGQKAWCMGELRLAEDALTHFLKKSVPHLIEDVSRSAVHIWLIRFVLHRPTRWRCDSLWTRSGTLLGLKNPYQNMNRTARVPACGGMRAEDVFKDQPTCQDPQLFHTLSYHTLPYLAIRFPPGFSTPLTIPGGQDVGLVKDPGLELRPFSGRGSRFRPPPRPNRPPAGVPSLATRNRNLNLEELKYLSERREGENKLESPPFLFFVFPFLLEEI